MISAASTDKLITFVRWINLQGNIF